MNLFLGLLGGFMVMGSVGSLETDAMTMIETLSYSTIGFVLVFRSLKNSGVMDQ